MVIAAGSVMNDPSSGAMVRIDSHHAAGVLLAEAGDAAQRAFGQR